jgi:hypothetical protein
MARRAKTSETDIDPASFVGDLSDKWLHCRELGHQWKPLTVSFDRKGGAYDRRLRCPSCRTVRIQVLTASGHVVSNRYDYPDGYLAKGVQTGTLHRDDFRLEAIVRFLSATQGKEHAS